MTRGGLFRVWTAVLILLGLAASDAPGATAPPGSVPYALQCIPVDGGAARPLEAWHIDGAVYVTANDLSRILGATLYWRSELARITLDVDSHSLSIMDGSALATIDGERILQMPGSAFLWEGRMMVPLLLVVDEVGKARPWISAPLEFDRTARLLSASVQRRASLRTISIQPDPLGWKLELEADGPMRFDLVRNERASFIFRLRDAEFDPMLFTLPTEHPWFQGLRLRPLADGVEVSFATGPRAVGYRLGSSKDRSRVEMLLGLDERDLREGTLRPFGVAQALIPATIRRVALDPGHGRALSDSDRNVEGRLALELAWSLSARLQERLDLAVTITRGPDEDPLPEERADRANRAGADILLSLHFHPGAGGPAAFVARAVPGVPAGAADLAGLGFRPFRNAQEPMLPTSRVLARSIVQALAVRTSQEPRGVFEEDLPELQGANCPAIMIELGLPEDGLKESELDSIAEGIVEGLRLFRISGEDYR